MKRPKSILRKQVIFLSEKEIEKDSTIVVRMLIQISAMLSDVDNLYQMVYAKHKLKKELNVFLRFIDVSLDEHVKRMFPAGPDTYIQVQADFFNYMNGFFPNENETTALLKVYVYAQSILMDLSEINNAYKSRCEVAQIIEPRINGLVSSINNQYKSLLIEKNKDGQSIDVLFGAYNDYVKSVVNSDV